MHTVHLNVIASEAFVSTLTELVSRGCPSRRARLNASRRSTRRLVSVRDIQCERELMQHRQRHSAPIWKPLLRELAQSADEDPG